MAPPVAAPPAEPAAPSAPAAWPPPGALPADEVERQLVPRRPTPTLRPNEVAPGARVGTAAPTDRTPAYTPAAVTTTRVGRSRITSVLARRPDLTLTRVAIVALAAILAVSAISNFVRASLNSNPGAEPSGGVGSPIVGEAPGVGSPGSSAEPAFGPIGPTDFAVVSGIVDGDTIRVDINGTEHRLRYIGIDSPEPDATDPLVKRLADAATAANAALVEGEEVYLEREESDTDQFGRLLRDVWVVDDTGKHVLINMTLVRLGYAQISTFPPDVRYVDELLMAQEAAQEEGLGLWASGTSGSPIGSGEAPVGTQIAPPPGASHDHAASPAPAGSSADCHPSYSPCLPIVADLDCAEVRAIGAAPVTVKGPDDYELDPAEDLLGCEPDE